MSRMIPFAPDIPLTRQILRDPGARFVGKALARTLISGERLLSVPVIGGSSMLKHTRGNMAQIMISDHGRWRQEHLGAWNATYGKTPFFQYLFPEIERVYMERSHSTLQEFNDSLFGIVTTFLDPDTLLPSLNELKNTNPERFAELRMEYERKVNLNYSIFDALFRLGRNSIWICSGD